MNGINVYVGINMIRYYDNDQWRLIWKKKIDISEHEIDHFDSCINTNVKKSFIDFLIA